MSFKHSRGGLCTHLVGFHDILQVEDPRRPSLFPSIGLLPENGLPNAKDIELGGESIGVGCEQRALCLPRSVAFGMQGSRLRKVSPRFVANRENCICRSLSTTEGELQLGYQLHVHIA